MSEKYIVTPIKVAVHTSRDNPIFGEQTTHVGIDDEGQGPFLVILQEADEQSTGKIRLAIEELEVIVQAARDMLKNYPKEE